MILATNSYARARDFLLEEARPLERAFFCFHFDCTCPVEARGALAAYQNRDGGFGRGLEPDIRLPASSAVVTAVGFRHLRQLGVTADDPMVQGAVRWTQQAFDCNLNRWPAAPAAVDIWPHAPWWTWRQPGAPGFMINPGAELVAHLWHYEELADAAFLAQVTDKAAAMIDTLPENPEMHDLLCVLCLAETPSVPSVLRTQAANRVRRAGLAVAQREPAQWTGFAATPLLLAPRADSLLAPLLRGAVDTNLDCEIGRQGPDGAWAAHWDWAGTYPDHWPEAALEWKGVLTLENLLTFRSYGRLPFVNHEASASAYARSGG